MWFFFQAEDGIRDIGVTGVQTCALPISGMGGDQRVQLLVVVADGAVRGASRRQRGASLRGQRAVGGAGAAVRSEEGRGGKEWRSRWAPYHYKKKNNACTHDYRSDRTTVR